MPYVYRHIRLDNNTPFYIGIGSDDNRSYGRSKRKGKYRSKEWNDIVDSSEYRIDIVLENLTFYEAQLKEREFISLYGFDLLCNKTKGGEGSYPKGVSNKPRKEKKNLSEYFTKERREKMSIIAKEYYKTHKKPPVTQSFRDKLRIANLGKKHTEKTKNILSEKHTGKKLSIETRKKIGMVWKGKKRTQENCINISKGKTGYKYSEEAKLNLKKAHERRTKEEVLKIHLTHSHPIEVFNIENDKIFTFNSISEASRELGMSFTSIKRRLKKAYEEDVYFFKLVAKA